MSASREKKQRQGSAAASNKAEAARQQASSARRKTIQYTVIGVVVALLVAALLIWNSGFFQNRAAAVDVNGTSYSVAEVSYFYHNTSAYQQTIYYAQYFGNYDTAASPRDQVYSTDSETGETTTYHDYFLQAAMDDLVTVTSLYDAAVKDGYTDADVKDDVAEGVKSFKASASSYGYGYKQFLAANYGSAVTPAVYERVLTRTMLASRYLNDHADSLEYSDEACQTYYQEHTDELDTYAYSYLYFTPEAVPTKDADGNDIEMTDEEKTAAEEKNLAQAKEKAEAAKKALEDGSKDAAELIEEYALTSADAEASAVGSSLSSTYSEWLTDAARKAGDVTLIENGTSGYYVVAFRDRYLDQTVSVNVRHILVRAEISEGASAPTEEQLAAAKTEAEDILARWKAGEATEASFAALADELSDDGRDESGALASPGGLYEKVIPGGFVTPFNDWLFNDGDRSPGDTGIIDVSTGQRYSGYHVAYFVGENAGDYAWRYGVRDTLTDEEVQSWMEDLAEGYAAQQTGGAKYLGK